MCTTVETGELQLWMRHKQLLMNYGVNLKGQDVSHPTKWVIQACWGRGAVQASSFGWSGELVAKEMGLDDKTFCPIVLWPSIPLWILETFNIDLQILKMK